MLAGEPALSGGDIDDLMGVAILEPDARLWLRSSGFNQYGRVQPQIPNGHAYEAQNEGTTGTTEPVWPTTAGGTVVDGGVTWKEVPGVYDLNIAAAQGWAWKAALAASNVALGAGGASLSKQQVFEHCKEMEHSYLQKLPATVLRAVRSDVIG